MSWTVKKNWYLTFRIFIKHLKNDRPIKKMKDASKNVRGIKKWNALFEKIMRVIWRCNNPEDGKKKELEAILQKMIE